MELVFLNESENIPEIQRYIDVQEEDLVAHFITELIGNSTGILSSEQIIIGEKIFSEFLNSEDTSYSLIGGKSGKLLALSMYLPLLSGHEVDNRMDKLYQKISSDEAIIFSDAIYNDWEEGRAGMLFAMSRLIVLKSNECVEKIFSSLLELLTMDARFFKRGIRWLESDLKHPDSFFTDVTVGIHLTLKYINNIFENELISLLVDSSKTPLRRDTEIRSVLKRPGNKKSQNDSTWTNNWMNIFDKLIYSTVNEQVINKKSLTFISKYKGLHDVIFANFREIFAQTPSFHLDVIIPELTGHCQRLNQYEILDRLKYAKPEIDQYAFKLMLRRMRLRAWLIDRSDVFDNAGEPDCNHYADCSRFHEMNESKFFNVKLAVNEKDIHYKILKSNWLYATKYAKKNIIGCFSVKRFDKSVFLNIDILDGFFPKMLMYLLNQEASVNQFKKDVLDNMNLDVNDVHLKNRILLLIRQGIFVPK